MIGRHRDGEPCSSSGGSDYSPGAQKTEIVRKKGRTDRFRCLSFFVKNWKADRDQDSQLMGHAKEIIKIDEYGEKNKCSGFPILFYIHV